MLKFAIRHLWKNKLYSFIKILGLAIGMACVLFTALFIKDEYSYDNFHQPHLYRITTTDYRNGGVKVIGATGQVQGPMFKARIPEVLDYVRVWNNITLNMFSDKKPLGVSILFADASLFKVFSFPLLHGSAPSRVHELVLSEETALKFFGTTNAVGKTLKVEDAATTTFIISGVAKSIPKNSSLQFEAVLPFQFLQTMFNDTDWLNMYMNTFVLLHPGAKPKKVQAEFDHVFATEAAAQLKAAGLKHTALQYSLQPVPDMHLNIYDVKDKNAKVEAGDLDDHSVYTYSYLLTGIALFILVMACVNFLNLSIAGSMERAKEVSMRKILGGTRMQIVGQFLKEATVVGSISYLLALALLMAGLPLFNKLAQKSITLSFPNDLLLFAAILALLLVCVLLVGLYPAIKGLQQKWTAKNYVSKSLIVLQFALAMGLVFTSIIYYRQMNFIAGRNLGYNPTDVIKVDVPIRRDDASFKQEVIQNPAIRYITRGGLTEWGMDTVMIDGRQLLIPQYHVDENSITALEIRLKEGRNFSSTDSNAVIVNEEFVRQAGWANPLMQTLKIPREGIKTVIGVVNNYHTESLKSTIRPQVLMLRHNEAVYVKTEKGKSLQALAAIEKAFRRAFPDHFFQAAFLDDSINNQYANETRWKQIISAATVLAIIVCCIGLFGLAHFATLRRTKEIGIRKVLGASVVSLLRLISDEFFKLVLVAVVIVAPVVWYVMNNWLQDFSYRIHISWLDVALTLMMAFLIALLTVGARVVKTALENPAKSLRTE